MKILFVKLSAIGDVVQTLPALEAVKKLHPMSEITWVVEEAASALLENHPLLDRVLVSRRKTWFRLLKNPLTAYRGITGIITFIRELRSRRYDIAIDFQGLLKSGILVGLARADRKIGFDRTRELSYLFLNERLPAYDIEKHALDRYLDIARYLGAADVQPTCDLHLRTELKTMQERIRSVTREGRLVVMNPVARWKTKLWPERSFADLADRLVKEKQATVILTGSRADHEINERIIAMMQEHALNWAGKTTLKEMAALARLSELFITTDTGPMHLAAAAGASVLALFGPTAPWRTGPHSQTSIVIRAGLGCSPCFKKQCARNIVCMQAITVQEVMSRIHFRK